MSTSSSTQSAMYHGVDFWKIVAWVKDELAARLNSSSAGGTSSSKTLRLTIGSAAFFNWRFAAERVPVSIDISDVAFSLAARRQLLIANVVDPRAYAFGTIC